jgi:hypothetical protein
MEIRGYVVAGWAQREVPLTGKSHLVSEHRLVPMDWSFHTLCGWFKPDDLWICAFCGKVFG